MHAMDSRITSHPIASIDKTKDGQKLQKKKTQL